MTTKPQGFAMLLLVIFMGAIGAAIATTLLYLSVGSAQTASAVQESTQANWLANTCAELALQQLITSSNYTGTATTTLGAGTCNYVVASVSSSLDSIKAYGMVNKTVRRVQVSIVIPTLVVSSWAEVADFQ